ncbi:hypothetical protein AAH991_23445 [Microbispora sp. ZYX-F-249]|uniref:Uncharacterized protein n=1 Tax=Microbispora maris TaxID=3144104 RepID=A0ABV0AS35_9ACTN
MQALGQIGERRASRSGGKARTPAVAVPTDQDGVLVPAVRRADNLLTGREPGAGAASPAG